MVRVPPRRGAVLSIAERFEESLTKLDFCVSLCYIRDAAVEPIAVSYLFGNVYCKYRGGWVIKACIPRVIFKVPHAFLHDKSNKVLR